MIVWSFNPALLIVRLLQFVATAVNNQSVTQSPSVFERTPPVTSSIEITVLVDTWPTEIFVRRSEVHVFERRI